MSTSALHDAAHRGDAPLVRSLLHNGANTNELDWKGSTPLFRACTSGHLLIARLLVDHGADVDMANDDGDTPLTGACREGRHGVAMLLLDAGADPESAKEYSTVKQWLETRSTSSMSRPESTGLVLPEASSPDDAATMMMCLPGPLGTDSEPPSKVT